MRHTLLSFCVVLAASSAVYAQKPTKLSPRSNAVTLQVEKSVAADSVVSAYINIDEAALDEAALESLGVKICMRIGERATARIPLESLSRLSDVRGVKYVQVASPAQSMLDKARPEIGADKVANGVNLLQPYTGKGVVVGVVDGGFDYTHAAFYDKEYNLRIKKVWEQWGTPSGNTQSPEAFGYGIELATAEAIEAAGGDVSNNSHGTHVTNIAAGSDDFMNGMLKGMAPDAEIVLVSMGEYSKDNVNISNAIKYIFDYADSQGKPCVVNLSLGDPLGPHDGTSTFDLIADELQSEGHLIVGAAGNNRKDKFHLSRVFSGENDAPLKTFVEYKKNVSVSNVGGDIDIWGEKGMEFEISLIAYKYNTKEEVERVLVYPSEETVQSVSLGRNVTGNVTVASEINPNNGKPHVVLTSGITGFRSNYAFAFEVKPKSKGQLDIWADNVKVGLESREIDGFSEPTTESTITEIGGTAKRILTVGAYTTRNEYSVINSTAVTKLDETIGAISSFSNYGPTADGRIKPNVTAPGCMIASAVSINGTTGIPLAYDNESNGRHSLYGYMQGTSMASPFVAGVVATWLQAHPKMTPEELHEIVKKTSRTDEYTGDLSNGSNDWGFGKIDAYAGLKECIELGSSGIDEIASFNGAISMRDGVIDVAFLEGVSNASVKVFAADGAMMIDKMISDVPAGGNVSVSVEALSAGIYILQVSTGSGVKTLKFKL